MEIKDLLEISKKFKRYDEGKDLFDDLSKLSQKEVQACAENYKPELLLQPVNLLRFLVAEQLKKGAAISEYLLERMKKAIESRDVSTYFILSPQIQNKLVNYKDSSKGMFPQWKKPFSILYPFFYQASLRQEIESNLKKIGDDLIEQNGIKDAKVHVVGFDGAQNYGSSRLWGAIIPSEAPNVQSAYQLFFSINEGHFEAGLYRGHKVEKTNFENIQENYSDLIEVSNAIGTLVEDWRQLNSSVDFGLSIDESDFKARLRGNSPQSLTFYFNKLDEIIKKLGIVDSENLVFSTGSNNLSFQIGKRYCLALKNNKFSFITLENYHIPGLKVGHFSQPHMSNFYKETEPSDVLEHLEAIIEAVHFEIERDNHAKQKEYDNSAFRKAVFDKIYRATFFDEDIINYKKTSNDMTNRIPLNQILFGPPGTGKTYHTINKALEIIEGKTEAELNLEDRLQLKRRYDEYVASGQIVFTTFHQSMSYEDFIEGIKPVNTNLNVTYEILDGIFKSIADEASQNYSKNINPSNDFEEVFSKLKNEWISSDKNEVEIKMKDKSYWITNITNRNINFRKASGGTGHDMVIKTLEALYTNERTMDSGLAIYYFPLIEKLRTFSAKQKKDVSNKNYVLIIDEINRGNVSQIFGELITLIEEDKRIGNSEELRIRLPYTKDKELFGVPPNLYIIGTMNTADRGVEALDTALRRRFVFEEMLPRPNILSPFHRLGMAWAKHWTHPNTKDFWDMWFKLEAQISILPKWKINNDISDELEKGLNPEDLKDWLEKYDYEVFFNRAVEVGPNAIRLDKMLKKMNLRIEKLLGKDYQIGHAFFVSVYTFDELRNVFHQKIIPLLQEYFYGDIGKIALVIGDDFLDKVNVGKVLFNSEIYYDKSVISDMESKVNYTFSKKESWTENSFIEIYS